MESTQSNKRPRASNTTNSTNEFNLSNTETLLFLSALQSIQEALAIVENNRIIHQNAAFQQLFSNDGHGQVDLTALRASQHGISENLVDHIQRTKSSGIQSSDLTIVLDGIPKGICVIYPISTSKTVLIFRPETKQLDWNEFIEEANEVISLGIEYLPVSPATNVYDGKIMFATRSFADLIGLIDDPTGKLLVHELGLAFKIDEWYRLAQSSMSPVERKDNFATCTFKSCDGKSKQIQCWARFVGLSAEKKPLLFINIKETRDTLNLSNSHLLQPFNASDLAVLGNPNAWKRFFDQSSIAMGVVQLVNNDTDVRIVITNPLGSVGIRPYLSEQIPPDQLRRTIEHYKQARLFARPVEIEQVYYIKGAEQTFYTLICFVHVAGSYFLYMSQDITPLKNLREKEQVQNQKMEQLVEQLASTSLAMSEMQSAVSQLEQVLQECTVTSPTQPELIRSADNCCHHLSTIIQSQATHTISSEHDLTAIDPPSSMVPAQVSVLATMQQAKSILCLQLQKKHIQLNIDCPSEVSFMGFPDALRRLIVNLLFTMTNLSSAQNILTLKVQQGATNNNSNTGLLEIIITNTDLSLLAKETLHVMERITQFSNLNPPSIQTTTIEEHKTSIAICHKLLKTLDAKISYDVISEDVSNALQLCLSIPVQCN